MINTILLPGLLAAAVAGLSPILLRPLLGRWGVVDRPNHRSSHTQPTIRGGGVAQMLGVAVAGSVVYATFEDRLDHGISLMIVLGASLLASIVGLVEDLRGVSTLLRAAIQIIIGVVLSVFLISSSSYAMWMVPPLAIAYAAIINFTNFMDGVNGISSLYGTVVGISFACLGFINNLDWLVASGTITAAAYLVFLPWNLAPSGMFLGDVGSYLLGALTAGMAIASAVSGIHPIAAMAPLAIYLADTVSTLVRRSLRGDPIFEAHRSHTYQKLTSRGMSHLGVASTVSLLSAICGILGIAIEADLLSIAFASVLLIVLSSFYLIMPQLGKGK
ncbi:UDP-N-acetylmuramyl pentapeptide phosphotransferase/UDP-N-acetylglucosamine-1-phosphate transferase [Micrococcus terreus]|uniref:UDP-N-acetylmuramyl pentapeptide phosphotransferase/UDP-N-acetylglucosamine-1-phosphate transferase n=1 Tax=Micrococcus terreus TaxID=574650 RepID=A0A1I7MEE9_9MICC|nr:UDP-N-acetylmuramyl pentapeptide phosphotransferase/UDP-N-acetylglucosamine-1-phosphate transferase [Micrococcus terreus]